MLGVAPAPCTAMCEPEVKPSTATTTKPSFCASKHASSTVTAVTSSTSKI